MPPNTIEVTPYEPKVVPFPGVETKSTAPENYGLHIFQATLNMVGRFCVGVVVAINLAFAFRFGVPVSVMNLHIILCVIGYQLLMAEACLALAPGSWTANLTLVDKRRVHWILLLAGSGLGIGGSVLKSIDNTLNWNTLHGKFGIVSVVFTGLSLINGLTSLYAYELRRIIPGNLSKLTHICFGVVAFLTATVSLIYGYNTGGFRNWLPNFRETVIVFTSLLIACVSINPLLTFLQKSRRILER